MTWGGLDEIFNPGAGHFREEMDRKRIEARIPGNEGGPDTVDLEKGVVRITVARKQDAVVDTAQDASVDDLRDERDARDESSESDESGESPQDAVHWPGSPQDAV